MAAHAKDLAVIRNACVASVICMATLSPRAGAEFVAYNSNEIGGVILRITPDGVATTFASGLPSPRGMAVDREGNLFVSVTGDGTIRRFTPGGVGSIFATGLAPRDLEIDAAGTLFASDGLSGSVRRFNADGTSTAFASGFDPRGLAFDAAGNLFVSAGDGTLRRFAADGTGSVFGTGLNDPFDVVADADGVAFVVNQLSVGFVDAEIRRYDAPGAGTTFSDADVRGLAVDLEGNLYASTAQNEILRFAPDGTRGVFASGLPDPFAIDIVAAATVPEPPSLALLIAGFAGLLAVASRRSRVTRGHSRCFESPRSRMTVHLRS